MTNTDEGDEVGIKDISNKSKYPNPNVNPADRELFKEARNALNYLQIEARAINGFTTTYLRNKYKIATKEDFESIFGVLL